MPGYTTSSKILGDTNTLGGRPVFRPNFQPYSRDFPLPDFLISRKDQCYLEFPPIPEGAPVIIPTTFGPYSAASLTVFEKKGPQALEIPAPQESKTGVITRLLGI